MTLSKISLDAIMNALRTVQDPDLKKDLVTLDRVQDLKIGSDGAVSLRVVLATAASPLKEKIKSEVEGALGQVPGVSSVAVTMAERARGQGAGDARVRAQGAGDARVRAQGAGRAAGGHAVSSRIDGVAHIIAVSSGKGGVGKSTVAVNLATALALDGARVGLMDADVYGPNVPTMMGVTDQPKIFEHATKGETFLPPTAHGVKVMSMGFLIQGDQPLVWRGPMLHSVVNQFCHKVDWGQLDYLIVDMPPGTGDVQLSLAQLVPVTGALLVTTPQEVSMQDVRKAFHMFEKVRVPVLGFVENMSYFKCDSCEKKHALFGSEGGKTLSRKYGVDLLAQLPIVPGVREGGDLGRPVVLQGSGSQSASTEIALAFRDLARRVAQSVSVLASTGTADPSQGIQIGKF